MYRLAYNTPASHPAKSAPVKKEYDEEMSIKKETRALRPANVNTSSFKPVYPFLISYLLYTFSSRLNSDPNKTPAAKIREFIPLFSKFSKHIVFTPACSPWHFLLSPVAHHMTLSPAYLGNS